MCHPTSLLPMFSRESFKVLPEREKNKRGAKQRNIDGWNEQDANAALDIVDAKHGEQSSVESEEHKRPKSDPSNQRTYRDSMG
jgi:hypothetical protein